MLSLYKKQLEKPILSEKRHISNILNGDQQYPVLPAEGAEANYATKATVPVETKYDITKNKNPTVVWYRYYEFKSVDTYNGRHGIDKTLQIGLSDGTIVTYEEYYGECNTFVGGSFYKSKQKYNM